MISSAIFSRSFALRRKQDRVIVGLREIPQDIKHPSRAIGSRPAVASSKTSSSDRESAKANMSFMPIPRESSSRSSWRKLKTLRTAQSARFCVLSIGKTAERCHILNLRGFRESARISNNADALLPLTLPSNMPFPIEQPSTSPSPSSGCKMPSSIFDRGGLSRSVRSDQAYNSNSLDGKPDIQDGSHRSASWVSYVYQCVHLNLSGRASSPRADRAFRADHPR